MSSSRIKVQIKNFHLQFKHAFKRWAIDPANFDSNIACLKALRDASITFTSYKRELISDLYTDRNSDAGFFKKRQHNHPINQMIKEIDDNYDYIINKIADPYMKRAHKVGAPVYGLNANTSEDQHVRIENHLITFIDGSTLKLTSLEKPEVLAAARAAFDEKIKSLGDVPVPPVRLGR